MIAIVEAAIGHQRHLLSNLVLPFYHACRILSTAVRVDGRRIERQRRAGTASGVVWLRTHPEEIERDVEDGFKAAAALAFLCAGQLHTGKDH